MNKSLSKIRHIQQSNILLEQRLSKRNLISEGTEDPKIPNPQQYGLTLVKDNGQLIQGYENYKGKVVGPVYEPDYDYILMSSDGKKGYACQTLNVGAMGPSCYSNNGSTDGSTGIVNKTTDIASAKKNIMSAPKQQGTQQQGTQQQGTQQQGTQQQGTQQQASRPKNVKHFQEWMDQRDPKWLKGTQLKQGKGCGTFGPNTTKAWNTYKNEYLKKFK